ncbi:MAG: TfoX/Sxy family protein [Solirubrobacterales bacterium]
MGRKGAKLTERATEAAEGLVAELAPLGEVTSRKMFGGYGIYEDGVMFVLVSSEGLPFLRVDDALRAELESEGAASPGKMPYVSVPGWPQPNDLLGRAERALGIARDAKR